MDKLRTRLTCAGPAARNAERWPDAGERELAPDGPVSRPAGEVGVRRQKQGMMSYESW
jgi:hypothetical protein